MRVMKIIGEMFQEREEKIFPGITALGYEIVIPDEKRISRL